MRLLAAAYREVADDVHEGRPVSPAAEWLLDNFHLVANEARGVWRDLPRKYHRRLPRVHPLIAMA
jgi:cyclic beta-1,2-glucan synthetase